MFSAGVLPRHRAKLGKRIRRHGWELSTLRVAALLFSPLLVGCQTLADAGHSAPRDAEVPSNYRQLIAQHLQTTSEYRRGARNAEISNPGIGWAGLIQGGEAMIVCVRFGELPGSRGRPLLRAYYFRAGRLAGDHDLTPRTTIDHINAGLTYRRICAGPRTYSPFHEVNS